MAKFIIIILFYFFKSQQPHGIYLFMITCTGSRKVLFCCKKKHQQNYKLKKKTTSTAPTKTGFVQLLRHIPALLYLFVVEFFMFELYITEFDRMSTVETTS